MRFLIFIGLTFILLSGCDSPLNEKANFSKSGLQAEVKWIEGPFGNIKKENHLVVFLYKDGGLFSLPDGQTLEFYATMPSMGHPLEDPGFFEEIDKGIYLNKSIHYNMPGDWKNELWIMDANFNILDRLEWLIYF